MPNQPYKPKEEKIGKNVGYKDNGADVKYYPEVRENKIKKQIKRICCILLIISFSVLVFLFCGKLLKKINLI